MRLVLASTSPARLATLRAVGIDPIAIAPGVDEEAAVAAAEAVDGPLPAERMVQLLARAKAEAVLPTVLDRIATGELDRDLLIFGGDSAFVLDGVTYGKPHRPEIARERWLRQRGRSGVLHSGHWLVAVRGGAVTASTGRPTSAVVHFAADVEDREIDAYVATGEPLRVAGAFTIDGRGAAFIDRVDGDPHTVVGLGIPTLRVLVRDLGLDWTALWSGDNRAGPTSEPGL